MTSLPIVLVVEDNVDLAELMCEIVQIAGVTAVYRTGVEDALDYISRNPVSTVALFTDINLGSPMGGIELAVYVAEEWPAIAICATSGFATERPRRLPAKAVFLSKPCAMPDVLRFVEAAIHR